MAEVNEAEAQGEIADIFAEVRSLWGVPYVSAIHRTMAGWPGFLEWSWGAVAPAFRSGRGQEAAWQTTTNLSLPELDLISPAALRAWGVNSAGLQAVRNAAEGFVRVAPVNMVFAGLVKRLLEGAAPSGPADGGRTWTAPPSLPSPPEMVDLSAIDTTARDTVMLFASDMGGKAFVPGLYRMLGHWPALVAHLATVMQPRLASAPVAKAFDDIRQRVDAVVPDVLAGLPPVPATHPHPSDADRARFLEIGQTYRKTSPELIVVGLLMGKALPERMD